MTAAQLSLVAIALLLVVATRAQCPGTVKFRRLLVL